MPVRSPCLKSYSTLKIFALSMCRSTQQTALGHDARADDRRDHQGGPETFRKKSAAKRRRYLAHHAAEAGLPPASLVLPMDSSCFCNVNWSSDRSGRLTKMLMRFVSIRIVSAKAKRISASLPVAAAGSGTPQWAVIGCSGQSGQLSPAALSQTV